MPTRWLLYPYAHTLYCTKYHKICVNGYRDWMQVLSAARLVTFRLEGQAERRRLAGGCLDARRVPRLGDHQPLAAPGGRMPYVVTN
jgi:hypothetical protein